MAAARFLGALRDILESGGFDHEPEISKSQLQNPLQQRSKFEKSARARIFP
jgi:hypothetical protein